MPGFNVTGKEGGQLPKNTVETGRSHRYKFETLGPDELSQLSFYCKKTGRPVFEVDRVTIHHMQDEIYVPGKDRWLPMDITMYEPIKGYDQTASAIYSWYAKSMINIKSSTQGQQSDYKKTCVLQLTDGFDDPVWTYKLYDVWISKVTPSDLSYAEDDLSDITFTIEIGKAEEIRGGASESSTSAGC